MSENILIKFNVGDWLQDGVKIEQAQPSRKSRFGNWYYAEKWLDVSSNEKRPAPNLVLQHLSFSSTCAV